jgi:hypothetical protein
VFLHVRAHARLPSTSQVSRRRYKLIAAAAASVIALCTGIAYAAPVTVALYQFDQRGDAASFAKVGGGKCQKKVTRKAKLGITVGPKTNRCVFRTSVIADSADPGPDQELAALVNIGKSTPGKLRKKAYVSVAVRANETSGYELRAFPGGGKWQLWRDPAGAGAAQRLSSGTAKFATPQEDQKDSKGTAISIRAFDSGAANPHILAKVNGKNVYSQPDSAASPPDGKRTQIATGAKGTAPGPGILGIFDNVAVRVPNPL